MHHASVAINTSSLYPRPETCWWLLITTPMTATSMTARMIHVKLKPEPSKPAAPSLCIKRAVAAGAETCLLTPAALGLLPNANAAKRLWTGLAFCCCCCCCFNRALFCACESAGALGALGADSFAVKRERGTCSRLVAIGILFLLVGRGYKQQCSCKVARQANYENQALCKVAVSKVGECAKGGGRATTRLCFC